jgi:hypothetical protein
MPKKVIWRSRRGDNSVPRQCHYGTNRFANKHIYLVAGNSNYAEMEQQGLNILRARANPNKTNAQFDLYGGAVTSINTLIVTTPTDLQEMEAQIILRCGNGNGEKHINIVIQGVLLNSRKARNGSLNTTVSLPDGTWTLPRPLTQADSQRVNIVRNATARVSAEVKGNYIHVYHLESSATS